MVVLPPHFIEYTCPSRYPSRQLSRVPCRNSGLSGITEQSRCTLHKIYLSIFFHAKGFGVWQAVVQSTKQELGTFGNNGTKSMHIFAFHQINGFFLKTSITLFILSFSLFFPLKDSRRQQIIACIDVFNLCLLERGYLTLQPRFLFSLVQGIVFFPRISSKVCHKKLFNC